MEDRMLTYRVTFEVSQLALEQVIKALNPDHMVLVGLVTLKTKGGHRGLPITLAHENGDDVEDEVPRRLTQPRYANGKRNKGISAVELVLKSLHEARKPHLTKTELTRIFVKHGFATTSVQSAISRLSQEQKVGCLANRVSLLKGRTVK